jgi:hypothetical protein
MWSRATGFALDGKLTAQELVWQQHVKPQLPELSEKSRQLRLKQRVLPATLEWAKKITDDDLAVMEGRKLFNRAAPKEDVEKLKLLKGHLRQGQFVTKFRKVFTRGEMNEDLELVRARLGGKDDDIEYYQILPTSPP